MSISQVKSSTLSSELRIWQEKFEREWNKNTKQDYYLAQIAYWLYLNWFIQVNDPKNPKAPERDFKSFLLTFNFGEKKQITKMVNLSVEEEYKMLDEEEKQKKLQASKRGWFRAMGLNSKGQPKSNVRYEKKKPPKLGKEYVPPPKKNRVMHGP